MKWSKEQIENIIGRKLLDFEYEFIDKYIKSKEERRKLDVFFARRNGRTRLIEEANLLYRLKAKAITVDEFQMAKESEKSEKNI